MTELFGVFWGKLLSRLFVVLIIVWLTCLCIRNIIELYERVTLWVSLIG